MRGGGGWRRLRALQSSPPPPSSAAPSPTPPPSGALRVRSTVGGGGSVVGGGDGGGFACVRAFRRARAASLARSRASVGGSRFVHIRQQFAEGAVRRHRRPISVDPRGGGCCGALSTQRAATPRSRRCSSIAAFRGKGSAPPATDCAAGRRERPRPAVSSFVPLLQRFTLVPSTPSPAPPGCPECAKHARRRAAGHSPSARATPA